jgi:hypothetical protein
MQIDPARAARWRERAEEYRVCADACISDGAKLAYLALADCADKIATGIDQGILSVSVRSTAGPGPALRNRVGRSG